MKLLFTICARAGSKGLKSKNTKDFNGHALVKYTLAAYRLFCKQYRECYEDIQLAVNTDSKILIEQIDKTNTEYIYINREESLSGDVVAKIDVIRDTLIKSEALKKEKFDIVVDLDLTSPIRMESDIKGTIDKVLEDSGADISFSVTESRRSPYFNMVSQKANGYFDRVIQADYVCRQQTPECYDMNASIYAYKRDYLMSDKGINRNAVVWKMRDTAVLDIDSEMDLKLMELLATYFLELPDYQNLKEEVENI